ncbi:MAG: GntR family transcriptional regulator [Acidobacteria bacterium]|nr:GntR family transcriptional regulator [Acidobacteriota bacterium]
MTLQDVLAELGATAKGTTHAATGLWVAEQLRHRIADGDLAPGTKLAEESLCEALGVSRNTLREAFTMLHAEHVVERIPNRGVFVARPSADDIRQIYRLRRFVEPAALLWSDDDGGLAALEAIVARAQVAAATLDITAMAGANQEFHRALVARAGSQYLNSTMELVLAQMRLVFHSMAVNPDFHAPYVAGNAQIVGLLREGNKAGAAELMTHYLGRAEAQLLAAMERSATHRR